MIYPEFWNETYFSINMFFEHNGNTNYSSYFKLIGNHGTTDEIEKTMGELEFNAELYR